LSYGQSESCVRKLRTEDLWYNPQLFQERYIVPS
jgi:hypothetical protein